jgi:hypothetical protein
VFDIAAEGLALKLPTRIVRLRSNDYLIMPVVVAPTTV